MYCYCFISGISLTDRRSFQTAPLLRCKALGKATYEDFTGGNPRYLGPSGRPTAISSPSKEFGNRTATLRLSCRNYPLPFLSGCDHSFLPDDDAADELTRRDALLQPSTIPCSLSPLVSTLLFFRIGGLIVSSKFFDTQLVFPGHGPCVLSCLYCN